MAVGSLSASQFEAYKAEIKRRESQGSGGYQAVNSIGYTGAYQMGAAALVDTGMIKPEAYKQAIASGRFNQKDFMSNPSNWTIPGGQQAFLQNPELQDRTFENYTQRNFQTLKRIGVVNENTDPGTAAGYLATSHLLGPGQAKKLANGQSTTTDANGTTARSYFETGKNAVKNEEQILAQSQKEAAPVPRVNEDTYSADSENAYGDEYSTSNPVKPSSGQSNDILRNEDVDEQGAAVGEGDYGGDYRTPNPEPGNDEFADDNTPDDVAPPTAKENVKPADGSVKKAEGSGAKSSGTVVKEVKIDARPNQLSGYASHTYNLSLYMISPRTYVELMKDPQGGIDKIISQSLVVVQSGGIGPSSKIVTETVDEVAEEETAQTVTSTVDLRGPFDVDFLIDNLQMTNIACSPRKKSSSTNAVEISFDIREPNGITLLERLKDAATTRLEAGQNYISTPYLLKISFKGYDDLGSQVSPIKPKYIPIKIIAIKFSIEASGALYRCTAVPYHQDILKSITSTIPINVQLTAGTVGEVFMSGITQSVREEKYLTQSEAANEFEAKDVSALGGTQKTKTILGEPAKGLGDALNKFEEAKTKPSDRQDKGKTITVQSMAEIANKYSFSIDPQIANAKLITSRFDALNTPQKTDKMYKTIGGPLGKKVGLVDPTKNLFKVNAGTNINSLITYLVVASDYVEQNLIDENNKGVDDTEAQNKPVKWFKIIPQIKDYLGWDKKAGSYKWHIEYKVQEYNMFYSDFPWAIKTLPKGDGVHKIYNYIFSGENTEVINFKLDFDAAYYQVNTLGTGIPKADKDESNVSPQTFVRSQAGDQGVSNDETVTQKRGKDLMSSLLHDGADMIQADLEIHGDPAFIPVGDSFWQPQSNENNSIWPEPFYPDGTINYDLTPPYIQVNLRTATGYDDLTGLLDPIATGKYKSTLFNGVYKVIETKSSFSGGIFKQTLKAVREKMQPVQGKIARSLESLQLVQQQQRQQQVQNLTGLLLQNILGAGAKGLPGFLQSGLAKVSTLSDSLNTSLQANRLQVIADSNGFSYEEGIGDEEPAAIVAEEPVIVTQQRTDTNNLLLSEFINENRAALNAAAQENEENVALG